MRIWGEHAITNADADAKARKAERPIDRFDAFQKLRREDFVLACLYRIEGAAGFRCHNDVNALSKLAMIACDARDAIERLTGSRDNPHFPGE